MFSQCLLKVSGAVLGTRRTEIAKMWVSDHSKQEVVAETGVKYSGAKEHFQNFFYRFPSTSNHLPQLLLTCLTLAEHAAGSADHKC